MNLYICEDLSYDLNINDAYWNHEFDGTSRLGNLRSIFLVKDNPI